MTCVKHLKGVAVHKMQPDQLEVKYIDITNGRVQEIWRRDKQDGRTSEPSEELRTVG